MTRPLRFEPFDAEPVAAAPDPGPSAEWRAGHARGLADAAESEARRRVVVEEAAIAALADLAFTWAEARAAVLAALAPFFRALADRLLPELAGEAFPLHLVEALARVAAADVATAPELHLSPEDAARVASLLAAAPPVRVTPDPALGPGQARLGRGPAETALDTPALVAALREVLAAFGDATDPTPPAQGRLDHG
jgi:hypothetical protein